MIRRPRCALVVLCACTAMIAVAGEQKKKAEPYAVVSGTVFRDPGYALPDAKVVLLAANDPKAKKLQEAVSNYRGEFTFRVPPRESKYVVKASLKGFRPDVKEAVINGEERIDVNLVLVPESK
ncbi:MAG TPA: carboxypeptidase-like regulatory domain-containing protein [Bryobacteraceae bacterium]|nr:carboxypeptidase-like regulatory domain-containing protein [Bryobacteraceae bacterium]